MVGSGGTAEGLKIAHEMGLDVKGERDPEKVEELERGVASIALQQALEQGERIRAQQVEDRKQRDETELNELISSLRSEVAAKEEREAQFPFKNVGMGRDSRESVPTIAG